MALSPITSYWKLEESGTNNRADELSLNTLTATSGMGNTASGIIGSAATFNGSSELSVADSVNLAIGGASAMSISAWVYQTSIGNNQTFVAKWNYSTQGVFAFQTTNGGADFRCFIADSASDGGGNLADSTDCGMASATWYHVLFVFDGTLSGNSNRFKVYFNGTQKTLSFSGTIPATLVNTGSALKFGVFEGLGRNLTGRMDDVGLFPGALTGADAIALYNSGAGKAYPFTSVPVGKIFRFNQAVNRASTY